MNDVDTTAMAFLARITESVTLDLRNVLATVKENAELLEELISSDGGLVSTERERFSHALRAIKEQVVRGVDLTTRLKAFSGALENGSTAMELYELLEMLVRICEPIVRLRGVTIRIAERDDPLIVLGKPLEIQMALFDCVDFVLNSWSSPGTIEISGSRKGPEELMVSFTLLDVSGQPSHERSLRADPARWDYLEERVKRVNGALTAHRAPMRLALVLRHELL